LIAIGQRGYALASWKYLIPGVWANMLVFQGDLPGDYPQECIWTSSDGQSTYTHCLGFDSHFGKLAPYSSVKALFDPIVDGQPFPLGVPVAQPFNAQNGWPQITFRQYLGKDQIGGPNIPPVGLPALGVDLRLTVELSRDPATSQSAGVKGDILA